MAKDREVQVDQIWTCRISQALVKVRILKEIVQDKDRLARFGIKGRRTRYLVRNLATNREVRVTAAKLRRFVGTWEQMQGEDAARRIEEMMKAAARSTQSASIGDSLTDEMEDYDDVDDDGGEEDESDILPCCKAPSDMGHRDGCPNNPYNKPAPITLDLHISTVWFPVIGCYGLEITEGGKRIFYQETMDPYMTLAGWVASKRKE